MNCLIKYVYTNCAVRKIKQFAILKIWIFTRTSMPRLRQNDRERAVGMVQAGMIHQALQTTLMSRITISRLMIQRRRARVQASLTVLWCCLRIGPTTGRLAQIPDLHSLLRTVWPDIPMFARPGVLRAVSSAFIIRFRMWIRRKCLSWRWYINLY
jgi:hypothetical protein